MKFRLLGEQPLRAKGFQYDRQRHDLDPGGCSGDNRQPGGSGATPEPVKTPGGEFLHL